MPGPSAALDPYRDWLGVESPERPPTAYALLRLPPLEASRAKIQVAFQRQVDQLSVRREEAEPELWERIDRELAEAYDTLCDPERKAVLDAAIRRNSGATVARPPTDAEQSGRKVTCRGCKSPNPPSRRFCSSCGQGLWEFCPRCKADCPADEKFCGTCGADIEGELKTLDDQYRAKYKQAQALSETHQYEEAIHHLRVLAAIEDLRFKKWIDRATKSIEGLAKRRSDLTTEAEQAQAKAQKLIAARAYEKAIALLDDVPQAFRTPTILQLLRQATAARNELLALSGEIREALQEKQTFGFLLKVERLLELRPDHEQASSLGEKVRDQFLASAKRNLAEGDFSQARETLEQITPTFKNDKVGALYERAAELESLVQELNSAALADSNLQSLADRLVQLAPDYAAGKKLQLQVREKSAGKPVDERYPVPDWRPQPVRSLLGCSADWLGELRAIPTADDKIREFLAEHPGDFGVALGLALQGLGRAALPLPLAAPKAKGFSLPNMASFFSSKPLVAWGLDLSDTALKAIQLTADKKTGAITIAACEYLLHSLSLAAPEAEFRKLEISEATLKDFVSRVNLKGAAVVASLPADRMLGRFFQLPPLAAKKVSATLTYEVRSQIPVPLEDLYWGHAILDPLPAKEADKSPRKVVAAAIRAAHVVEREQVFQRAGIRVDQFQSESIALHNALSAEFFPEPPKPDKKKGEKAPAEPPPPPNENAYAAVDVGALSTSVVVCWRSGVWFRNISISGAGVTSQLVKQFQLTFDQAEALKRNPAKAPRFYRYCEAVHPLLQQLAGEVERSLETFRKLYPEHPIKQVFGVGGGFRTQGLLRYLRQGK